MGKGLGSPPPLGLGMMLHAGSWYGQGDAEPFPSWRSAVTQRKRNLVMDNPTLGRTSPGMRSGGFFPTGGQGMAGAHGSLAPSRSLQVLPWPHACICQ